MDQQNNFISLIAVFLALGIGILMGASMGESTLVENQIAVIEELRKEVLDQNKVLDEYVFRMVQLQEDLARWEYLEREYLNDMLLKDSMRDTAVKVLTQQELPEQVEEFFKLSGCFYEIYIIPEPGKWQDPALIEALKDELEPGTEAVGDNILLDALAGFLKEGGDLDGRLLSALAKWSLLEIKRQGVEEDRPGDSTPADIRDPQKEPAKVLYVTAGELDEPLRYIAERIQKEGGRAVHISYADHSIDAGPAGYQGEDIIEGLDSFYGRIKFIHLGRTMGQTGAAN